MKILKNELNRKEKTICLVLQPENQSEDEFIYELKQLLNPISSGILLEKRIHDLEVELTDNQYKYLSKLYKRTQKAGLKCE